MDANNPARPFFPMNLNHWGRRVCDTIDRNRHLVVAFEGAVLSAVDRLATGRKLSKLERYFRNNPRSRF